MGRTMNWHTKAIHLVVALAFALGLAIVSGTASNAMMEPPSLLPPDIAFDVKGAIHEVCIDAGDYDLAGATIDWWLVPGVNLNPDDVTVISPTGPNPDGGNYEDTIKTKGDTDDTVKCIELRAMKWGDIHIYVKITIPGVKEPFLLHTEKKWGQLCYTELDVNPDLPGVQHREKVTVPATATGYLEEDITDMVYASFLEVAGCRRAGHAIVHWWLFEDTEKNQGFIDDLMDYLASNEGSVDAEHWAAHGRYMATDPFLGGKEPWDYINDYALTHHASSAIFHWDKINPDTPGAIWAPGWYAWNESEDSLPGETRGQAQATLTVDLDALEPCAPEKVMIVVLVSYPSGVTPQDDPYNGENFVCVEKGKKEFHKIGATVSIPDVDVCQDESEVVPITIADVVDLRGAIIWLYYDEMVVEVDSIGSGDLGAFAAVDVDTPGELGITWSSSTAWTGNFVFAYVTLHAVGNPGETSTLDLWVQSLYAIDYEPISHNVDDGLFTILENYALQVAISPAGGGGVSKHPDLAEYCDGTEVMLSATPASGYQFDYWSGDVSGTANPINVTMNANKSVTAHFEIGPLSPHFIVDKYVLAVGENVTFDPSSTVGGTLPYTRARWDFEGDGVWDEDSDVTGKDPLAIVTHAYPEFGTYYPCLEITDSSTPPVVGTKCMMPPDAIIVDTLPPTGYWDLEYGLDADPAALNIWQYPCYGVEVTLADVYWSMPDGLLIWHYGMPWGWQFYKKGWGSANTLETLVPCEGYIGIVPTASIWLIPQE